MQFISREQAKTYIKSFLDWMYTGIVQSGNKKTRNTLAKQLRDMNDAFAYMCRSYEQEIAHLQEELKNREDVH